MEALSNNLTSIVHQQRTDVWIRGRKAKTFLRQFQRAAKELLVSVDG
jgi:hypothetical protein